MHEISNINHHHIHLSTETEVLNPRIISLLEVPMPELMLYNGGGLVFIQLLRDENPNSLLHPTIEIITSSTVEINFTWINLTRSRWHIFFPMTHGLSQNII